jgi:hypothetical protein
MAQQVRVNGGPGVAVEPTPAADRFIRNGFTISCSANSNVAVNDLGPGRFAIAGASFRGNQMHIGSSSSGAVRVEARTGGARSCEANNRCTAAEVTAARGRVEDEVPAAVAPTP